jgi:hypothetical protein
MRHLMICFSARLRLRRRSASFPAGKVAVATYLEIDAIASGRRAVDGRTKESSRLIACV